VLRELVAQWREGRPIVDSAREDRRDRDDHASPRHGQVVGDDGNIAGGALLDPADRRVQPDA
jgi:hypothetical protein